jgi:hypothetical protein
MRESRPYGSVRGARDETRVPTATLRHFRFGTKRTLIRRSLMSVNGGRPEVDGPRSN